MKTKCVIYERVAELQEFIFLKGVYTKISLLAFAVGRFLYYSKQFMLFIKSIIIFCCFSLSLLKLLINNL